MQVKVNNLKKYFGKTKAVDDISFGFSSGQIAAFVGPNGAGKTTAMRVMATIDDPDDGDVLIDGVSVVQYPEKARDYVGFMPDFLPTHGDMTVDDYLDFFARAFGINSDERKRVIEDVEGFTNLLGIRHKFLQALSKGMKQRVSLARAIIHDPPVLILDEPAAGLDPRARVELREALVSLAKRGKAILISSHILSELSEICDTVVIIEKGKLLRSGGIDQIASEKPHCTILIRTKSDSNEVEKALREMEKIKNVKITNIGILADFDGAEDDSGEIITSLIKQNYDIIEVKHIKSNLEDVFMDITKGELA